MDSTGNFYRLTQFFFFPLNTRPFPLPIPYSLSPLSYSKLSSIRAAYFHQRLLHILLGVQHGLIGLL